MSEDVPAAPRSLARDRANGRCEYCLLHEDDAWVPHEPDHIIARKHRGRTEEPNLAWTCFSCNRHKGTDVASVDEDTGRIVRLFHPRRDRWTKHFRLRGALLPGRPHTSRTRDRAAAPVQPPGPCAHATSADHCRVLSSVSWSAGGLHYRERKGENMEYFSCAAL
jgi:hypothetical protein